MKSLQNSTKSQLDVLNINFIITITKRKREEGEYTSLVKKQKLPQQYNSLYKTNFIIEPENTH